MHIIVMYAYFIEKLILNCVFLFDVAENISASDTQLEPLNTQMNLK